MKGCLKKTFVTIMLIILLLTTTNVMSIASEIGDEIVNYEVLIRLKSEKEIVKAGEEHKITIKNSYSTPNAKENAHIKVHITDENGNPNTNGQILGMIDNKMIFQSNGEHQETVTVELKKELDENGKISDYYLDYSLSPGTTTQIELQMLVPNGMCNEEETIVLKPERVDERGQSSNNKIDEELSVKWVAQFNWSNLIKGANIDSVKINTENKLSKNIDYNFSAENFSSDVGCIYTYSVKVKDTLTLPDCISLPDNITYNGNNIYSNDELLFSINMPESYIGRYNILDLNAENNAITFELVVFNPNLEDNKVNGNFNPFSDITTTLYSDKLNIAQGYVSNGNDKISNIIEATMYPANKTTSEIVLNAEKDITIAEDKEELSISKKVNKTKVNSKNKDIIYTITMKNNSRFAVTKTFTDNLPVEVTLTDTCIDELKKNGYSVSENAPYIISKEIEIGGEETIELLLNCIVDTKKAKTITNTVKLGDLTSSASIMVEIDDISLEKEITSRYANYLNYNSSKKITEGDELNLISDGDIIEYTVTLTNNTSESKIVGLMDISPICNSAYNLNSFSYYGNSFVGNTMKFGMVGYTTNSYYYVENYKYMTNQYNGFASNSNSIESRGPTGASIYCEVEIPANSELKQTYILVVPKAVQNGEEYNYSYDAFLDAVRYNSGYYNNPDNRPNYEIPYNYIYVWSNPEINAIVYHKVETRYYVQTGVLARNTYQDMMNGNATIDMYNTDLSKFSLSDNEIITYYSYFINDSINELDMEDTTIKLKVPKGFRFLGFNTLKYNTYNSNGPITIISSPTTYTNFYENTYNYDTLFVNDFRGLSPYKSNYNRYQANNYLNENDDIEWDCWSNEYGEFEIEAEGILKPGQGCYIIYSCQSNSYYSEDDYTDSSINGVNYVKWVIDDYERVIKSDSYEIVGYWGKYTSNGATNLNDGKCYDSETSYDYDKDIEEDFYDNDENSVWSAVKIEPSIIKSAQIKKQAIFAYDKNNKENGNSTFDESIFNTKIYGDYINFNDGVHNLDNNYDSVIWKVTITNDGECGISPSTIYEIIDKPFELKMVGFKYFDMNGQTLGIGGGMNANATTVKNEGDKERNVYEINYNLQYNKINPGYRVEIYFATEMQEKTIGDFYDTTIMKIDQDEKEEEWEFKIPQVDSNINGYSGIKSDDWISNNKIDAVKYIDKGTLREVNSKKEEKYNIRINKENELDFTLKLESHLYQDEKYTRGKIKNIEIYDLLPGINGDKENDTDVGGGYVLNPDSLSVYILKTNGNKEEIIRDNYNIKYTLNSLRTTNRLEYTQGVNDTKYNVNFNEAQDENIWQDEYTKDMRAFRVKFNENVQLENGDMLFIKYTANTREDKKALEYGNIMGYKYDLISNLDETTTITEDISPVVVKVQNYTDTTVKINKRDSEGKYISFNNTNVTYRILDENKNEINFKKKYSWGNNEYEYAEQNDENTVEEIITGNSLTIYKLPVGTYYVQEVQAPNNYEINPELIEFSITNEDVDNNNIINVEVRDNIINEKGTLEINKIDSVTNELITEGKAKFKVQKYISWNKREDYKFIDLNIQDDEGSHYRMATEEDSDEEKVEELSTYKGKINISGLDLEQRYYISEIEAPEGYEISTKENSIYIYKTSPNYILNYKNNSISNNNIIISKIDYENNLITEDGAKFEVYDENGNKVYFEKKDNTEDYSVYKITNDTNENATTIIETYNGKIRLKGITVGKNYTLKEIEAPEGYVASSEETIMNIAENKEYQYTVQNGKDRGNVSIQKTNLDGELIESNAVVFKLYNEQDEEMKLVYNENEENTAREYYLSEDNSENTHTRLTTLNGKINISNLPIGKYYLKEIIAPSGYTPIEDKIEFEIKADSYCNPVQINVKNLEYQFGTDKHISASYQRIQEKGNDSNYGYSYYGKEDDYKNGNYNYISINSKKNFVRYSLNVSNKSEKNFEKLVIIDKLPFVGDSGTVNLNESRNSEFDIKLSENPNFELIMKDENGNLIETSFDNYKIEYTDEIQYTNNDWDGVENQKWYDIPKETTRSFRIIFINGAVLPKNYNLTVKFDGKLSENAQPTQIAWNSFGYRYYVGESQLTAEPPKVGVKISSKIKLSKQTSDNSSGTYEFEIYDGKDLVKSVDIEAGKSIELELKYFDDEKEYGDLKNGKTYIIKEKQTKSMYLSDICIDGIHTNGNVVTLRYDKEKNAEIVFTNSPREQAKATILKLDEETGEPLKNVKFRLLDSNGNAIKLLKNDENEYFIDNEKGEENLETNENGKISIINLPYGDYIIREIETLDGYEKKDEEIKFSINNESYEEKDGKIINIEKIIEVFNKKIDKKDPEINEPKDDTPDKPNNKPNDESKDDSKNDTLEDPSDKPKDDSKNDITDRPSDKPKVDDKNNNIENPKDNGEKKEEKPTFLPFTGWAMPNYIITICGIILIIAIIIGWKIFYEKKIKYNLFLK